MPKAKLQLGGKEHQTGHSSGKYTSHTEKLYIRKDTLS